MKVEKKIEKKKIAIMNQIYKIKNLMNIDYLMI